MMLLILLLFVMWAAYAYYDAKEEAFWSFPFRMLDWGLLEHKKKEYNNEVHKHGAYGVATLLIFISGAYTVAMSYHHNDLLLIADYWIAFFLQGAVYWLVFDIKYASCIGQKWYYLGDTADTDSWLVKYLGKDAGKKKAYLMMGSITALLLIHFIFL